MLLLLPALAAADHGPSSRTYMGLERGDACISTAHSASRSCRAGRVQSMDGTPSSASSWYVISKPESRNLGPVCGTITSTLYASVSDEFPPYEAACPPHVGVLQPTSTSVDSSGLFDQRGGGRLFHNHCSQCLDDEYYDLLPRGTRHAAFYDSAKAAFVLVDDVGDATQGLGSATPLRGHAVLLQHRKADDPLKHVLINARNAEPYDLLSPEGLYLLASGAISELKGHVDFSRCTVVDVVVRATGGGRRLVRSTRYCGSGVAANVRERALARLGGTHSL